MLKTESGIHLFLYPRSVCHPKIQVEHKLRYRKTVYSIRINPAGHHLNPTQLIERGQKKIKAAGSEFDFYMLKVFTF